MFGQWTWNRLYIPGVRVEGVKVERKEGWVKGKVLWEGDSVRKFTKEGGGDDGRSEG